VIASWSARVFRLGAGLAPRVALRQMDDNVAVALAGDRGALPAGQVMPLGNATTKPPLPSRAGIGLQSAEDGGLDRCEGRWRNTVSKKEPRARYTRGASALVLGSRIKRARH
jgi:hypothetical protein